MIEKEKTKSKVKSASSKKKIELELAIAAKQSVKQSNIELMKKFSIGDKLLLELVWKVSGNTDDSYDIGTVESYAFSDANELVLLVKLANKKCKWPDKANCEPSHVLVNPKENGSYMASWQWTSDEVVITNLTQQGA